MLLVTLRASLLGNMLTGEEKLRAGYENIKTFKSTPSFNKFCNAKILSE